MAAGHLTWPFLKQIAVLSILCDLTGCAARRLEDMIGPPPSIMKADEGRSAEGNLAGNTTPDLPDAGRSEQSPSILAVPRFDERARWQAFHSVEGYDATDATGTICSGLMIGGSSRILKGERIPLACSDGRNVTLLVTELTSGGGAGVIIVGGIQESAAIIDSDGSE